MKHQNKRRQRTEQLGRYGRLLSAEEIAAIQREPYRMFTPTMREMADNAIEQHRFTKLVKQGIIVKELNV